MLAQADPSIWSMMLTGLIVATVLGVVPIAILALFLRKKMREAPPDSGAARSPNDTP